jgi:hypothetical protein
MSGWWWDEFGEGAGWRSGFSLDPSLNAIRDPIQKIGEAAREDATMSCEVFVNVFRA